MTGRTAAEALALTLDSVPEAEAIVSRHHHLTYARLSVLAEEAASQLIEMGVRPGDRVAGSCGNHAELVVAFMGAMRIGAVWLGVNTSSSPAEVDFILADSGASILLGDTEQCSSVGARASELPELREIIDMSAAAGDGSWFHHLDTLPLVDRRTVDPHAPAAIAYTSGTTGRPKGVVHSQHNLMLPGAVRAHAADDQGGRPGVCLPLTILNLMILGPLISVQQGLPCILMDRIDAVGLAEWIGRERVSTFSMVPAMVHDLLTNPAVDSADLESLTRPGVGGAECPQSIKDLYEERFGLRITTGYGLTEAPTMVTAESPNEPPVMGSSGPAQPQLEVTIRDDAGAEVEQGGIGEVCVSAARSGPFAGEYTPMLEYWRNPEATAAAFHDDGALRTGDIGRLDAEGNLLITDRKNDLIIRGGANVYPAEVERVLSGFPEIAAVAVVAVPDERLGERVAAAIVPSDGATVDLLSIQARCADDLAKYKIPEFIAIIDAFPRNAMGKIVKRDVVPLVKQQLALEESPNQ
jgi:long-chain acyl-CoA synthetase